jgi:hypothetical protein
LLELGVLSARDGAAVLLGARKPHFVSHPDDIR